MVTHALKCDAISEFTLIIRTKLPIWEELEVKDENFKNKIKYIIRENFDDMSDCA
jgi:hypothetical protein